MDPASARVVFALAATAAAPREASGAVVPSAAVDALAAVFGAGIS